MTLLRIALIRKGLEKMWKKSSCHCCYLWVWCCSELQCAPIPWAWDVRSCCSGMKKGETAWLQGEVNNVSTIALQSCLELVAVWPHGFSAVIHWDILNSAGICLLVCSLLAISFYLNIAAKLPTICMVESRLLQWICSFYSINQGYLCVHDGKRLLVPPSPQGAVVQNTTRSSLLE